MCYYTTSGLTKAYVSLPLPRNAFKAVSQGEMGRERGDDALRANFTTFRGTSRKIFPFLKYLKGPPSCSVLTKCQMSH